MTNTNRVYVGTYAKYNEGNLAGDWVDLEQFNDAEEFQEFIKVLHSDEVDPEFMFQDYEGFPSEFYSESSIDSRVFEYCQLELGEQIIVDAFLECFGDCAGDLFEASQNAYYGNYESDAAFAKELMESTRDVPDHLKDYIDYDKYARDLMVDFASSNDRYFTSNW